MSQSLINQVSTEVKIKLSGEGSGHDWWHVYRVVKLGKRIAEEEKADVEIVELALLLHDIADYKFYGGDHEIGPKTAREILERFSAPEETITHVCNIIRTISFKGAAFSSEAATLEAKICEDADRLDALGAIGIARAFATGAKFDEIFHDPNIAVPEHDSEESYSIAKGAEGRTVINHFHEKLLLLKDRMNTAAARKVAEERHAYMVKYIEQFLAEWEGKL
ncbi:MAG: hypothetical protein RJB39_786 [Candidatus Parcubacteria bacterium]|jgi:uncharacterized protein